MLCFIDKSSDTLTHNELSFHLVSKPLTPMLTNASPLNAHGQSTLCVFFTPFFNLPIVFDFILFSLF